MTYTLSTYGKDQRLDHDQQLKQAHLQNSLMVTPAAVANGLFTIDDGLVAANITALGQAGVAVTADQLFDMSVIAEIYSENPSLVSAFAAAAATVTGTPSS